MPLAINHPLREQRAHAYSPSIGGTPAAGYTTAPFRGSIQKFVAVTQGIITTADCTVTVAVNGTTIGTMSIPVAGAAAGQFASGTPTTIALSAVSEDDVISFTPAGASGVSISCAFAALIRAG